MEYHNAYLSDDEDILLNIEVMDWNSRIRIEYNTYNYSPVTIRRFLNTYLSVLEYITTNPKAKLGSLGGPSQRHQGRSAIQQQKKQSYPSTGKNMLMERKR
jgi:hypothetical protein